MATEAYADTKARIAEEEADVHLTADLGGQKALDKSKIAANRCAAIAIAASTPSKASGMEPQQQDAHDANANAWDSRRLRDTVRMTQLTVEMCRVHLAQQVHRMRRLHDQRRAARRQVPVLLRQPGPDGPGFRPYAASPLKC